MQAEFTKIKLYALIICLLVFVLEIYDSPAYSQQIKLNSGTYLNYSGNSIVVNGKIDNAGEIKNNGIYGLRISGDLQNTGTFIAGAADHKIGGNFSNNGIFNPAGSTITFNGISVQMIGGTSRTTFNNLTIDNAAGVRLIHDSLTNVSGNLTINDGKKFEINPGRRLSVVGNIVNNGGQNGFIIHSDATGDGKLINNTSSVSATVELYLSGGLGLFGYSYHYFVPPVQLMNFDNTDPATAGASLNLTDFHGDLVAYSEPLATAGQDFGWIYFDNYTAGGIYPLSPFNTLSSSRGYSIYLRNNDTPVFKGELNATDHTFNLTKSTPGFGWNLIGNPFPCNYDLQGITKLALNEVDGVDNNVYFTYQGGYAYWNVFTKIGINWNSDIIPPMQGFFVLVTESTSLTLPASLKTTSPGHTRAKGYSDEKNPFQKVRLVLNKGTLSDETVVCLSDKTTAGFDRNYDAYKLFNSNIVTPYIYTELNSQKYAINFLEGPEKEPVIVPVTIELKTEGTYKIDITEFENLDSLKVILRHGALETILSGDATYSFTSAAGKFTDFSLIFGNKTSGIEMLSVETIKTWYYNKYLYIHFPDMISAKRGRLLIYDINSKMVFNKYLYDITPGQTIQVPLDLPSGFYVTQVIIDNRQFVSKIVVI